MRLAERAERRREEFGLPALAVAVIRSDGIDTAVTGRRRLDADAPAETRDRFHLGSNTKAMTATLAAIFVERGLIAWDTTARETLHVEHAHPDVTLTTPDACRGRAAARRGRGNRGARTHTCLTA